MANVIKIKKGLDINLKGKAVETNLTAEKSDVFALIPDDYVGIVPKVIAKVGDIVKAGSVLMIDKNRPEIHFVSPVSGEVVAVNRGEKRKVLDILIKADGNDEYIDFGKKSVSSLSGEQVKAAILEAGLWPFVKMRPYDRVANPQDAPRDIFVSGFYSAPLAPNFDYIVKGQEADFQTGLDALAKLTTGKVYLGVRNGSTLQAKGIEVINVAGPHPAGNVGVQINQTKPVNKGEVVWVMDPADVIFIGRLFNKGITDLARTVAVTGSETTERGYLKTKVGATMKSILKGKVLEKNHLRYISGNVLTGTKVSLDGYLRGYHNQVTVIPEGDNVHELFGWATLGLNKFSFSHSYFTWLQGRNKEYVIDARIRGGKRAIIMSDEYDSVFPMSILPEFLIKAVIAYDIDKMESLGIYEVAPEDFALCEFVDTSKLEIQKIIRTGLDMLYKEMN